jgi:hypothetical protein
MPPSIVAMTPAAGATGVLPTAAMTAQFSEPMAPATVNAAAVQLLDASLSPMAAEVVYDDVSQTVTVTPEAPLDFLASYTVRVIGGAGGVTDITGTAMTSDVSWTFSVRGEMTPPEISSIAVEPAVTTAIVTWTTDEPSTSRVTFGTSADQLSSAQTDGALVTQHAVTLSGLTAGTPYFFRVGSTDAASNEALAPAAPDGPLTFTTAAPPGLVAAYGFNEGTGGVVVDSSGNGNHGAISGASWTSGGRYGNALSFDGVNDWVTVNPSATLDLSTGMTIEAWVRPSSSSGWRTILYKERAAEGLSWALYSSDDSAPPAVYAARTGSLWSHATGSSMLPLNAWRHVVGTYDGTTLRLYVNGSLVRSVALGGAMLVGDGPLRIGGNAPSLPFGGQFFRGVIDEIRIYNRALTLSEIRADQNTPLR